MKSASIFAVVNFRDNRPFPVIDLDINEKEVLSRYDTAIRTLTVNGICKLLSKPLTDEDVGKNIQFSLLDFALNHAFNGRVYVDRIQMNMQYTLLQAALILTISMTFYINPPPFNDATYGHLFSALIGFSAFSHLGCIVCATIFSGALNMAYNPVDALVIRVKGQTLFVGMTVCNYLAIVTAITAMIISGFDRSDIDGAVQMYGVVVVVFCLTMFVKMQSLGAYAQDTRAIEFYKKYCEASGELKDEYLNLIYSPAEGEV